MNADMGPKRTLICAIRFVTHGPKLPLGSDAISDGSAGKSTEPNLRENGSRS